MSGDVKPTTSSEDGLSNFRWGFSASAGAGVATRSDGNSTSVGPQFELALGPYVHWGKNSLAPTFFTNFLSLHSPLFGQADSPWVKTIGAKLNYGRDLLPWLSLRGQFGLGLAIYGDFSKFSSPQAGVYTRETFVGPHFDIGAGLCFLQDKLCALVSYNYDLNAYTREVSDQRSEFTTFQYNSSNAQGASFLLSLDLGRL